MICCVGGKTCGACCWAPSRSREELATRLRRHRDLFPRAHLPGKLGLLWHELRARLGLDLLLAPLLRIPYLESRIRSWFGERVVCAFVAFRDSSETAVGCLLHPSRWEGRDRRGSAFRLLSGFGCGPADYFCDSARSFATAPVQLRRDFEERARELDWFDYGRAASRFRSPQPERSLQPSRSAKARSDEPRGWGPRGTQGRPSRRRVAEREGVGVGPHDTNQGDPSCR